CWVTAFWRRSARGGVRRGAVICASWWRGVALSCPQASLSWKEASQRLGRVPFRSSAVNVGESWECCLSLSFDVFATLLLLAPFGVAVLAPMISRETGKA